MEQNELRERVSGDLKELGEFFSGYLEKHGADPRVVEAFSKLAHQLKRELTAGIKEQGTNVRLQEFANKDLRAVLSGASLLLDARDDGPSYEKARRQYGPDEQETARKFVDITNQRLEKIAKGEA